MENTLLGLPSSADERRVARRGGRPWAETGHPVATAGRRQALIAARWRTISTKPRALVRTHALTLSLSTALSRSRRKEPSAVELQHHSIVA